MVQQETAEIEKLKATFEHIYGVSCEEVDELLKLPDMLEVLNLLGTLWLKYDHEYVCDQTLSYNRPRIEHEEFCT
jgi:hypothetical protein